MLNITQKLPNSSLKKNNQTNFGNNQPITARNNQNYSRVTSLKDELNNVIENIGGIEIRSEKLFG
ncbi:MAG: hypothetical protein WCK67_11430 [bacterium]